MSVVSDPIMNITGNRMFQLKQDIAALRECLAACVDEDRKKKIRSLRGCGLSEAELDLLTKE